MGVVAFENLERIIRGEVPAGTIRGWIADRLDLSRAVGVGLGQSRAEPVRMRLPGGAVRLDVRFGPDGVDLEVPRPPAPAPPPAPPEPGAPPPRAPRRRGGLCGWLRRRLRR